MSIEIEWGVYPHKKSGQGQCWLLVRGTCVNRVAGIRLAWTDEKERYSSVVEILNWLQVMKGAPGFEFEWVLCASAFGLVELDMSFRVSRRESGECKGSFCTSDYAIGTSPVMSPEDLHSMIQKPIVWDGKDRIGTFNDVQLDHWDYSSTQVGPEVYRHRLGSRVQVFFTLYRPVLFPWLWPALDYVSGELPTGMVDKMSEQSREDGVGFEVEL